MLKELRTQHRTIIQMVFSGFKNHEIAERLEMSQSSVSQIIRSPLGQAYLKGLQDKSQQATLDVRKKLLSLNPKALNTIEELLTVKKVPHNVQLSAAKDVLDRTGFKAPDRLQVDMTMQTKTDEEIEAEIAAVQQSIQKTYHQDPGQATEPETKPDLKTAQDQSQNENSTFTDEQPVCLQETVNSSPEENIFPEESYIEPDLSEIPEPKMPELDKIPADIFQNKD